MKRIILALIASASLTLAGSSGYGPAPSGIGPGSAPSLLGGGLLENLFIGGSVGYLHESEEEMWHGHIGVDLQPKLFGSDQAIFLEVGYNELEFFNVKQEIIPLTLNYKLERPVFGAVSIYAGAGGGIAFYEVSGGFSADDEVFWGQVFGGLVYNVSESLEILAGVRGVYLDEVDLNGFTTQSGDDLLWEIGGRFNF